MTAYNAVNLAFYAALVSNGNVGPGAAFYVDGIFVDGFGYDTATDHENFNKIFRVTVPPGYHCYTFYYSNTNDAVSSGTIISYQ